jgi:hypothetical protein
MKEKIRSICGHPYKDACSNVLENNKKCSVYIEKSFTDCDHTIKV